MLRGLRTASHKARWSDQQCLEPNWDERTAQLASFIGAGSRVVDCGAGRKALKRYLPPDCTYTPLDLVDRGEGTIVCDLNGRELPTLQGFDVVVFSGVLEYIFDVPRVARHMANCCQAVVASYAVAQNRGYRARAARRRLGWVNDFSRDEFVDIFVSVGFTCDPCGRWCDQELFKFVKNS
jgi:hypothetical protein